jgi:hypothetical protein
VTRPTTEDEQLASVMEQPLGAVAGDTAAEEEAFVLKLQAGSPRSSKQILAPLFSTSTEGDNQ